MPHTDLRGLPLSTSSDAAAQAYNEGVELVLSGWPTAAAQLDAAIAADPDFALAHVARARLHAMAGEGPEAAARLADARRLVSTRGDGREQSHVEIVGLALDQKPAEALEQVLAHLERWPRDIQIFSMPLGAFGLFAFSGMRDHDQARVDLCARHATAFDRDDWWFLAMAGWAYAENGEVARGRGMLERSIDLRQANANGVHALAHAMHEAGAGAEAEQLLSDWLPGYDRAGVLHGHLAWHAALVALDAGDPDRALKIYAAAVQPSVSLGLPINVVTDAASLLWRLDLHGAKAPTALWEPVADYARSAFPKAGHAFIDTHMLMIAAATGDGEALERRLLALEGLVDAGRLGAGGVVPALGRALRAFAEQDYAACLAHLQPLAAEVVRIGGSGAQREVIEDTLLVAHIRAGNVRQAQTLLDARLHRRPSPRDLQWRRRLAA